MILDCLESVFKSDYSDYEVIVVDNASKDGSPDSVREKFPQVRLISNEKNLGFTGGNNVGIKEAKGELIFLLNDDTVIRLDLLKVLTAKLGSSPRIGIVGPKIYFWDGLTRLRGAAAGQSKIWFAGGKIDWLRGKTCHLGKGRSELENDAEKETDFITGCALMIKKEVIDKIGLLDERFFAFYEDADWCLKAKKAGYLVLYIPFGGVWHIKSATASTVYFKDIEGKYLRMLGRYLKTALNLKYRNYRNRLIVFLRHAPFAYKIIFLFNFIFILTPKFLWSVLIVTPLSLVKIAGKHL